MNDMTPSKIASLFTGLDILARAQFMEGFSGATPANSALRGKTGAVALLAKIKELADEISPNISPAWWDKQESGLYRPIYKLADRMGASQGIDAHDVMNEELSNEKGSIFYAAGRMARVGGKGNGIKTGELGPSDLQGIIKNLAIKSVKDALDEIVRHRKLESEQAALLTETTTGVGGLDQTEWSMITDGILAQPNHPISKEFFAWLKGITDKMTGAESRLMSQYLDLIISGQASSETEAGEILGLPNLAYLGRVKRKFMDMAAEMLGDESGRAPGVQKIKDLLSDASFLNQLLKGRVPGSRTAKLLAKVQKIAMARRAAQKKIPKLKKGDEIEVTFYDPADADPAPFYGHYDVVSVNGSNVEVADVKTGKKKSIDLAEYSVQSVEKVASNRPLTAHDYSMMLRGAGSVTTAKFPAGKKMTVDEVAKKVGPEFKEMNENPPESVKKVMEDMKKKSSVLIATDDFANMLRYSRHKKDVSVDPTEGMSPEDAAKWKSMNEKYKDKFKTAKYEKGESVDPTENMSAEDAAEWEANKDNFKVAGRVARNGYTGRVIVAGNGYVEDSILKASESLSLASGGMYYRIYGDGVLFDPRSPEFKVVDNAYNKIEEITKDLAKIYRSLSNVDLQFTGRAASDKTAAGGRYGFTKAADKSCTGAADKLAKYASKLAKELYKKDADTAPFLEEHGKRGFKTANMLRTSMEDIGPGPAPKTAASKSGTGLYGFKDRTAKLAMDACSELHQAAGHLAADLAAKFGAKHAEGAGFLKKHAKAAKCAYSDLILDSYPSAPVKVSTPKKAHLDPTVDEIIAWDRAVNNRLATSFLAAEEDDLVADSLIEGSDFEPLSEWDAEVMAGRTWNGDTSRPDDNVPYNKHPESPPAGADGSPQRKNYNRWFRKNACPDHATGCGIPSLQG